MAKCDGTHVTPLPAAPEDLVRYIAVLEARGAKPATAAGRVSSLATAHSLSGMWKRGHARTSHVMVRAALKGLRRRRGAAQRQAAPLRFGATLDPHTKGFALTALLGA